LEPAGDEKFRSVANFLGIDWAIEVAGTIGPTGATACTGGYLPNLAFQDRGSRSRNREVNPRRTPQ